MSARRFDPVLLELRAQRLPGNAQPLGRLGLVAARLPQRHSRLELRRAIRRLSSNLFSFGMMSLVGAASAFTLGALLRYGFGEVTTSQHSFPAVVHVENPLRQVDNGAAGTRRPREKMMQH